jgi:hypothetical protein
MIDAENLDRHLYNNDIRGTGLRFRDGVPTITVTIDRQQCTIDENGVITCPEGVDYSAIQALVTDFTSG